MKMPSLKCTGKVSDKAQVAHYREDKEYVFIYTKLLAFYPITTKSLKVFFNP